MGKYFTLSELIASNTADRMGIDNVPPADVVVRLNALIENVLDPVREMWGKPIIVNSGYRCPRLNDVVGGVKNSDHQFGNAADIEAGNNDKNKRLFEAIVEMYDNGEIEFDQLIDEADYAWVHISYRGKDNRNQILHL